VDPETSLKSFRTKCCPQNIAEQYSAAMQYMEQARIAWTA
jgi:hypothetical protein